MSRFIGASQVASRSFRCSDHSRAHSIGNRRDFDQLVQIPIRP
jgi:hypothetical protein